MADLFTHNIRVFISHKRIPPPNANATPEQRLAGNTATEQARALYNYLTSEHGYTVFIDDRNLQGGQNWAEEIYRNVRLADVLIVLLQEHTADSDWIQREVDMARGANIKILPVKIDADVDIFKARERLQLGGVQEEYFTGQSEDYERIHRCVRDLAHATREAQDEWMRIQRGRWRQPKAEEHPRTATFRFPNPPGWLIHIATGDLTRLANDDGSPIFDAIVNSENNYMQMARIYEIHSISGNLRLKGALIDDQDQLIEDTVQHELDIQLSHPQSRYRRPVRDWLVVPTHAGHPDSTLVRTTGARYILHAASVRVDTTGTVSRMTGEAGAVERVVHNCLRKIAQIDDARGVIFPPETEQHAQETAHSADYQPIRSVIFPIFGGGLAMQNTRSTIAAMLHGFRSFPGTHPHDFKRLSLTDLYIAAYSAGTGEMIEEEMALRLERVSGAWLFK
jgi:hypothetical protein